MRDPNETLDKAKRAALLAAESYVYAAVARGRIILPGNIQALEYSGEKPYPFSVHGITEPIEGEVWPCKRDEATGVALARICDFIKGS